MTVGSGSGHRHSDSKSKDAFHHHHLIRATVPSGASAVSGASVALAWPSCWRRTRRPLLLALGALGAVALILRILGSDEAAGGSSRGSSLLSSSSSTKHTSATGVGQRRPGSWDRARKVVTDPSDPGFRALEVAPFAGQPWRTAQTLEVFPVVATTFGVCEIHRVRGEDGKEIDGWLWFDEKDQVNVLARLAPEHDNDNDDEGHQPPPPQQQQQGQQGQGQKQKQKQAGEGKRGRFLLFEQRKYGFEGLSLAPIGGLVEPGEEALAAAQRELLEEAGLVADRWTMLGRYRISSTRGGGFLNVFLADHCRPAATQRASDDMEHQTPIYLSAPQLASAVLEGRFKEAKWSQTVAMALLHLSTRGHERIH